MAFTLRFGRVSKRRNSTLVPDLDEELSVVLKDGCSETAPVFIINADGFYYNYCQWGTWYYWITDVEYTRNNLYTVSCELDYLATFRSNILNTSAFVLYDTSENTEISDHRLSVKTTQTTVVNSDSFSTIGSGVCAVLSITGDDSTSSWAMSVSDARGILNTMNTWMDGSDIAPIPPGSSPDIVEAVDTFIDSFVKICRQLLASGKVSDCIKSARICPWPASICGEAGSNIRLGQYGSGKGGYKVDPTHGKITDTAVINIPWQASDWRRNNPYHELYLYIPYIGVIALSPSDLIGESQILVNLHVYLSTGDASITVRTATRQIAQYNTNLSAPFEIGASNASPASAFVSGAAAIGGVLGSVFTGGAAAVGAAAMAGSSAIAGITNNIQGMPSSISGNAGGAVFAVGNTCYLFSIFHDTVVDPASVAAVMGTPAHAVKSLGSLSGYVQTAGASVSAAVEAEILDKINAALDGGVFIE